MKPVSLRLENFRSYRSSEPIEFGDAALVGLVGPTGAGKSSILEAMIYALYGERSDSKQKQDELIAFNERGMAVTFHFSVHGEAYQLYRSRRNGLAVQRLTLPNGASYSAMDEVDEQVKALIGVSKEAFLKTVLLPQGRFDELLLETGGNRAKILAQVLGLNYFDALNSNAKVERDRAATVKTAAEGARKILPDKPGVDALEVEGALASTRAIVTQLEALRDKYGQAEAALSLSDKDLREVDTVLERLAAIEHFESALISVRAQAHGLGPGLIAASEALALAQTQQMACEEAFRARGEAGLDLATISTVREQLGRLRLFNLERRGEQERYDADIRSLEERQEAYSKAKARKAEADGALQPLVFAMQGAEAALTAATSAARTFSDLNAEHGRCAGILREERAALESCTSAIGIAEEGEGIAAAAQGAALTALTHARGAVSLAEQENAAAFLGAHLHPGDECPVCSSQVPKTFIARELQDVTIATGLLEQALRAERVTNSKHVTAQATLQSARDAARQQTARLTKAEAALTAIGDRLSAICGAVPVNQKLEDLNNQVTEANTEAETARRRVSDVEQELARTKQALGSEREQLTTLQGKAKASKAALERRDRAVAEIIKALPHRWIPDETSNVDALLAQLDKERQHSEKVEDDLRKAQGIRTTALDERTRLEREFEKLVNRPLQSLRDQATAYAQSIGHELPLPDLTADDEFFDTLLDAVATKRLILSGKRSELLTQRSQIEAQLKALLDTAGGDIPGGHAIALAEVARLGERLATLRAQVEQVAAVEKTIAAAIPIYGALDAITKATAANQFPEYLTNQYVSRLLSIGSDYLMEMTGHFRFMQPNFEGRAFEKELRILDVQAGATMPPQNLSGGEKFLASLALSLAVVDQAALAGAKIDSLFLDEGFASLDSDALDKAMMELRARARKGRSIWVITHLREVARYADRTYRVDKGPNGSTIVLHDGDIEEPQDITGLLTVLT